MGWRARPVRGRNCFGDDVIPYSREARQHYAGSGNRYTVGPLRNRDHQSFAGDLPVQDLDALFLT